MEYRRVQLLAKDNNKGGKGHEVSSSTFSFEGITRVLSGNKTLSLPLYVARAWNTADSNVVILPER